MSAPKNKNLEQKPVAPNLEKMPYEPPQAVFVPLKMEELMSIPCAKSDDSCTGGPIQS